MNSIVLRVPRALIITIASLFIITPVMAQNQGGMSYQAIVRNMTGDLVQNLPVGMQISILHGSIVGPSVYTETHTTPTNINGLVSIEIGGGTIIYGDFDTIHWENGPYFIKTETDPNGGNNYTITGTSQLLSVPYALYAKTAMSFSGTLTETDPLYNASIASGITGADTAFWNNKLSTYTETQTLADVAAINNAVNTQLKNVTDPTEAQDAATKAYVDALLARIDALEQSDFLNNGFVDIRDNNHYDVVKIGNQIWTAENLKYLPSVVGPASSSGTIPYYYVYGYNGTDVTAAKATANYTTYGVLYNWPAAMNGASSSATNPSGVQGVCPAGWHLPSDAEWAQLTDYLGGTSLAGGKLKENGTTHWISPNTGATNSSGFTALPGGYFNPGSFSSIGYYGEWWSTSLDYLGNPWYLNLEYNSSNGARYANSMSMGIYIRCIKD